MQWYNLSEEERIKNVYGKFTIKQFWDWWSDGEPKVMGIRLPKWETTQEVAKKLKLPYDASGVFVFNDEELKKVISMVRNNSVCWYTINPRKKNFNAKGWKVYGGKDEFVEQISHLFIDIDRVEKDGFATNEQLKNCDDIANSIIKMLGIKGFDNSYIKIASGNGVQLLFKLDEPIELPELVFIKESGVYENNNLYNDKKKLFKNGIGKVLRSSLKKECALKGVEIDSSAFYMGKVGSLPFTKNFKYGGFKWRGIIEMKTGVNDGLADYISAVRAPDSYITPINSKKRKRGLEYVGKGKLRQNTLAKMLLEEKLPEGERNNKVWFPLLMLLRDSDFDLQSEEFIEFHKEVEKKQNNKFTTTFPNENVYDFNKWACIKYAIKYLMPLPFEIKRKVKFETCLNGLMTKENLERYKGGKAILLEDTDIFVDIEKYREQLNLLERSSNFKENEKNKKSTSQNNLLKVSLFYYALIDKYGQEAAEYYRKVLFEPFFCFSDK